MSKKKKKKNNISTNQSIAEYIRRKNELESYGKILSTRGSRIHKSPKDYSRQTLKKLDKDNQGILDFRLEYERSNISIKWLNNNNIM